jgi:hypothetical protein
MDDKQQSAFPHPKDGGVWGNDPVPGMTLRDYFAAHAPSFSEIEFERKESHIEVVKEHSPDESGNTRSIVKESHLEPIEQWKARWRYAYADAMMAEREKK